MGRVLLIACTGVSRPIFSSPDRTTAGAIDNVYPRERAVRVPLDKRIKKPHASGMWLFFYQEFDTSDKLA